MNVFTIMISQFWLVTLVNRKTGKGDIKKQIRPFVNIIPTRQALINQS